MTRITLSYVLTFLVLCLVWMVKVFVPDAPTTLDFRLPAVSKEDVTKIIFTKGDVSTVIEKGTNPNQPWMITSPFEYPADASQLDGLLELFKDEIPMDLKMSGNEKDHESFEVTTDKGVKVELHKSGSVEIAIVIGKNASGGTQYIRPVNSSEVFRAKVGSRSRFDKAADDWREKKILNLNKDEISRLEVTYDDKSMVYVREGETWRAQEPSTLVIDRAAMDAMLRNISTLRAAEIITDPVSDAGMAAPRMKLTVIAGANTHAVLIGAEKASGEFYAQVEGGSQLFTVRDSSLNAFRKTPDELKDKSVHSINPDMLSGITITRAEKRIVLQKNGDEWKLVEPGGASVDRAGVQALMAGITTLKASRWLSVPDAAKAEFGAAAIELVLEQSDGKKSTLTIGSPTGTAEFSARSSEREGLFALREASVNNFRRLLGDPVPKPQAPGGMAGSPQLPPGMQLPPGVQLPANIQ